MRTCCYLVFGTELFTDCSPRRSPATCRELTRVSFLRCRTDALPNHRHRVRSDAAFQSPLREATVIICGRQFQSSSVFFVDEGTNIDEGRLSLRRSASAPSRPPRRAAPSAVRSMPTAADCHRTAHLERLRHPSRRSPAPSLLVGRPP